jgi:hypothetical protein
MSHHAVASIRIPMIAPSEQRGQFVLIDLPMRPQDFHNRQGHFRIVRMPPRGIRWFPPLQKHLCLRIKETLTERVARPQAVKSELNPLHAFVVIGRKVRHVRLPGRCLDSMRTGRLRAAISPADGLAASTPVLDSPGKSKISCFFVISTVIINPHANDPQ